MKRSWFGFGILLVLLIAALLTTWAMDEIHEPIAGDLEQAAEFALLDDWENAELFYSRAAEKWEKWEHLRACFADHTPVEEISAELAELEIYGIARENAAFAAACAETAEKGEAVGEAHGLVWWNIL